MWKTSVYEQNGETKLVSVSDDGGVRFSRPCDMKSKRKKPQEEELMKINSVTLDQNTTYITVDFSCKVFDEKKFASVNYLFQADADVNSSSLLAIDTIVSNNEENVLIAYGGRNGLLRIHSL